jgi:hypothetical protein
MRAGKQRISRLSMQWTRMHSGLITDHRIQSTCNSSGARLFLAEFLPVRAPALTG